MKTSIVMIAFLVFGALGASNVLESKNREQQYHVVLPELVITPTTYLEYAEGTAMNPIVLDSVEIVAKKI